MRRKKQSKQPYIVGALMILLTFALAFFLIFLTSKDATLVDGSISSTQTSSSSSDKDTTSASSSNDTSSVPSSTNQTSEPVKESSAMAFTQDEIAQINALIEASKNSQYTAPSSDVSSEVVIAPLAGSSEATSSEDIFRVAVPSHVSIYFEDIESGYVYTSNEDYKYFIASLIKAPYSMYLFTLAQQGKCDLNEQLPIAFKDIEEGTGKIKDIEEEKFPISMSVRELISYAIRYSDNTAMETLRKQYNHVGYLEYVTALGIHYPEDVSYMVDGDITAKDAGILLKAIYNYIETGVYGKELEEDMRNTTNPMIRSQYPITRKYAWAELAFHDMAIVEADHPYLLIILSDKGLGTGADHKLFADISRLIESFQLKRYKE